MSQKIDVEEWHNAGSSIKDEMIRYNWEYRKKICSKCTDQERLQCRKYDNFVDDIQETHCRNLISARTKKFENKIEEFLQIHPCLSPVNV